MRKSVWAVLLLVVFVPLTVGIFYPFAPAKGEDKGPYPQIFFPEKRHDFGVAYQGDKVKHIFSFENRGKGKLLIERVQTSCGCTAALISAREIPPGETGKIKVTFNTKGRRGRNEKHITVYSNDPRHRITTLKIGGIVKVAVEAKPSLINFGRIPRGRQVTQNTRILAAEGQTIAIKKVEPSAKNLVAQVIPDKTGYQLKVSLKPPLPIGKYREKIRVYTSSKKQSILDIPVYASVTDDIVVAPERVFLPGPQPPQSLESLINDLQDEDEDVREEAAYELGERGDQRAVQPLIRALKDKDAWVRESVAEALGKLKNEEAVQPLKALLKDRDEDVRDAAAEALEEINAGTGP